MSFRTIATGISLLLMVAACGTAAPAGTTSPTGTPPSGASATPATAATPSAVTSSPASAPGATLPAFVGDPDLAAKFPQQVAGQPVTNVTTSKLIDFFTAFSVPQAQIDSSRQALAGVGIDLNAVLLGNANATVDGSSVGIQAVRIPGMDAGKLIPIYALFSTSSSGDKVTQETSGGKSVSVLRDDAGYASAWMYPSGDILWVVNSSDEKEAAAVFSALP